MTVDPDAAGFLRALGDRVRLLRVSRRLTQAELAAHTEMSRNFISLLEHGTHGIDVLRLRALAAFFDLTVAELLSDLDSPHQPLPRSILTPER